MAALRIDEFVSACDSLTSEIDIGYQAVSPALKFSNSGRRGGKKYFTLTMSELLQTLKDIESNITDYLAVPNYVEATYRTLFANTITTPTVHALSTVQTMPLFVVLNKVITVANGLENSFDPKIMRIGPQEINNAIQYISSQMPDNNAYLSGLSGSLSSKKSDKNGAENVIYYGAPGSGKSYKIDQECDETNSKRIIFHPDTQYSDFVGCLRPSMNGNDVQYTFRPGPFTNAIIAADKSDDHFYLVIEEINRASAAAVFGEIFQLLDRKPDGESVYSIDLSDADMEDFIKNAAPDCLTGGKLRIPSNLSILATMNSSDQAVMPMDTAFKRRWRFEYVPIDFSESPNGCLLIPVSGSVSSVSIEWSAFAQIINDILEQNQIPEDRLLGPWFLSQDELKDTQSASNALKGKLLLYLWDDVLRHGEHAVLFDSDIRGFGRLVKRLSDRQAIFNEVVEAKILSAVEPVGNIPEVAPLNSDESEDNAQDS